MDTPIALLVIEDSPVDFRLVERHLVQGGLAVRCHRVATGEELEAALQQGGWDAILSDFSVPPLDFETMLKCLQIRVPELPLILVSGSVGEERAVELLRQGVWDFVLKDNLSRLVPALERSLRDAAERRARRLAEADLRASRLAALNMMEDAVEARHEAERISAALHQEVKERQEAVAALRESEDRFRTLFQCAAISILVHNPETGAIVEANRKAIETYGFNTLAELQRNDFWLEPPYSAEDALRLIRRAAAEGPQRFEWKNRDRHGRVFWEDIQLDALTLAGARRVIAVAHDITARKQAEEALRESEDLYHSLVENLPQHVFRKDLAGRFIFGNGPFCASLGKSLAEVLGGTDADFGPPELAEKYRLDDLRVMETGRPFEGEESFVQADGRAVVVNVLKTPLRDATGQIVGIQGISWDISERRRLEQERAAMEAQLRQQQKLESIGTLAGGVAHEINNPINGIMNYAQLIQDRLEPGSPLAEYTGEILHESQRVATIVCDLLTFARNERQSHSPARIIDIVESTLSLIRTVIRHDQITLTIQIPSDLPAVNCRSQQLQQVVMNLMTNARDALNERYAGHDPNKILRVEAGLIEKGGGRWIRLTVEDFGTGITPAVRQRMFDPFFTTKPRDQGTGLGLSISHSIAKDHGGDLTVESEPGRFTRLHLDLPV